MRIERATEFVVRTRRMYDDFRTVQMSRDYYACKLSRFKKLNLAYEVLLAIGASSTVAGWYVWETRAGKVGWAVYAGSVAVLAIAKPILQVPKEIERYSKLHIGYSDLYYDLRDLVDEIQANQGITEGISLAMSKALKRYRDLALQDDAKPSARLLEKCYKEVDLKHAPFENWFAQVNRSKEGQKDGRP